MAYTPLAAASLLPHEGIRPMKIRLTELIVGRLRPPKDQKYELYADTLLPSFGLRVYRGGTKAWGITRRWRGAKTTSFRPFGNYPEMSLAQARARAREILADPDAEVDHLSGKQPSAETESATTFKTLAEQFLAHGRTKRGRPLRPATTKGYRRALLVYAQALHGMPVEDIRRADIAAGIRATAANSGPTTAMRTRAALSRFLSWAMANGLVEVNVATGTEGYAIERRRRVLTDAELCTLWGAIAGDGDFDLILRLCLWTGARRGEIGGMRWSELAEDGTWTLPEVRAKNHRELVLPLPRQALRALEGFRRFVGRDLLFGRTSAGFQGWSQSKARLDARLGFAHDWDLHDLRRSVQTRLAGLGFAQDLVNRILNHAMAPLVETYDRHSYLAEKAAALQAWADQLDRIVAAEPGAVHMFA
jgi:integrase